MTYKNDFQDDFWKNITEDDKSKILERWNGLGFTYGLCEEDKKQLSVLFENVARTLSTDDVDIKNEAIATIVFPIVRRLFVIEKHIEELLADSHELLSRVDSDYSLKRKEGSFKGTVDYEAESCVDLCKKVCDESIDLHKVDED